MNSIKQKNSGMSLIEVIIGLGILGIGIAAITAAITSSKKVEKEQSYREAQRLVADKIAKAISNEDALAKSTKIRPATNTPLANCVKENQTCLHVGERNRTGFYLADPFDTVQIGPGRTVFAPIAGPPGRGIRYDTEGRLCARGSNCIFSAEVEFWGACPLDRSLSPPAADARCANPFDPADPSPLQPIDLMFRYKVRVLAPQYKIPDYPRQNPDDPLGGTFSFRRAAIALNLNQTCGPNERQVGIDSAGNIICECVVKQTDASGRPILDASGKPICGTQRCRQRGSIQEVMVGFDSQGNIECVNQNRCTNAYRAIAEGTSTAMDEALARLCPCEQIQINDPIKSQCTDGFWMVNLTWGQCWAVTDKSKAEPDVVKCDKNYGVCCKLDAD